MTITKAALQSFDPVKLQMSGYTLRADWSREWVQVSIQPASGPTHYLRPSHEDFMQWVRDLAAATRVTLHHEQACPDCGQEQPGCRHPTCPSRKTLVGKLREQIEDAELALNVWDPSHSSEYWLRHPGQQTTEGK